MSEIILPRRDKDGNYYISYSQYSSWKDLKSFNMGLLGKVEYMACYFFGVQFPDQGWALFGSEVEDYICHKKWFEKFNERERGVMDTITPLGNFQVEVKYWILPNVYIYGFIDDATEDLSYLRDYKTASANSKARYYKEDYTQLDIYALYARQQTGKIPEKLEVCIIERKGNCFGMVERRDLLSVGEQIWYRPRETSIERLTKVESDLIAAIKDISYMYQLYLKMQRL
jgi:hypothetical protein